MSWESGVNETLYKSIGFCGLGDRSFGEDAQILQVIENYCASSKLKYTANAGELSVSKTAVKLE